MKRILSPVEIIRGLREERGAAAIEFVISFPVIVVATLIIFDVGAVIGRSSVLNTAARDAARYASARAQDNLLPVTVSDIETYAMDAAILSSADTVTVTITPPASYDPDEDDAGTGGFITGAKVEVELTGLHTFFVASFFGMDPITLTGRAELIVI